MIKFYLIFLFFIVFQAVFAQTNLPVYDSNILYVGRWDKSASDVYHSYWGGAYIKVKFTGKSIKLKLAAPVNLVVNIDDGVNVKIAGIAGDNVMNTSSLRGGTHTAIIAAQGRYDEIQCKGLILDDGATTVSAPVNDIIEYIGNSITSGDITTLDYLTAYAWPTGRILTNSEHTQIAMPGITLVDGYSFYPGWNEAPRKGMNVQYFCMKEPNQDFVTQWNFSNYTPRIIVMNLGTNDKTLNVKADLFSSSYTKFINDVRVKFSTTDIFVMRTFNGSFAAETEALVNQLITSGDTKLHFINTTGWLTAEDFGKDGLHPTDAGHEKIATKLAPVLQAFLSPETAVKPLRNNDAELVIVYPNPANNFVSLQVEQYASSVVKIFNINGQQLYSAKLLQSKTQIDVSSFEKGIYLIEISGSGSIVTKKMIIN